MDSTPLQVAKRELHRFFNTRAAWVGALAAGLILGLAGPFGTLDVMRLLPRVVYWVAIAGITYLTGSIINAVLRQALPPRLPVWAGAAITAFAISLCVTLEIFGVNALVFGFVPTGAGLAALFGNVFMVSVVISTALGYATGAPMTPEPDEPQPQPRLLERLPFDRRGSLIALSSVDHYVEMLTDQGTEMLLMRLTDAIAETHPLTGLHVHRSHWVALDHVKAVHKGAGKATLTLSNDSQIPVSRGNLPLLKEAGLLPN